MTMPPEPPEPPQPPGPPGPPPPPEAPGPPPPTGGDQPGGSPAASAPWDLGSTVKYGWEKFQQNMAQMIIATIAIVVGAIVIFGIGALVQGLLPSADYECDYDDVGFATDCDWEGGTPTIIRFGVWMLFVALFLLFAQIVGSGLIRGALGVTEGRPFVAADVFKFDRIGPVVTTSLIVAGATFVGYLLCFVPGLIVAFATSYALFFVVDKGMAPMDAIRASIDLVKNNVGPTLIWFIVGGLIAELGFVLCGVGALVSIPVVLLGTAYTYKKLTGQPVAG